MFGTNLLDRRSKPERIADQAWEHLLSAVSYAGDSVRDTARSACTASQVRASTNCASWARSKVASARTSMPSAPCPAAGIICVWSKRMRIRLASPSRLRPAAASTMAS